MAMRRRSRRWRGRRPPRRRDGKGRAVARRVLVVSSRFPWPVVTGDRIRALAWLQALTPRAGVTLVAPPGLVPSGVPPFTFVAARRSPAALAAAAARAVAEGLPATALLAAGYDWRGALSRAQGEAGAFAAAVVLLARLDPWVVRHIRADRMVFEAVDSLAANLEARAAASRGPARRLWRWEAARTRRLESDAARRYDRTLVVAEAERAAFGERAAAIFHGVELDPPATGDRDFDVGFWGRLAYFANRDAAGLVLDGVWPRVRALRPGPAARPRRARDPRRRGWRSTRDGPRTRHRSRDHPSRAGPARRRGRSPRPAPRTPPAPPRPPPGSGRSGAPRRSPGAGCAPPPLSLIHISEPTRPY